MTSSNHTTNKAYLLSYTSTPPPRRWLNLLCGVLNDFTVVAVEQLRTTQVSARPYPVPDRLVSPSSRLPGHGVAFLFFSHRQSNTDFASLSPGKLSFGELVGASEALRLVASLCRVMMNALSFRQDSREVESKQIRVRRKSGHDECLVALLSWQYEYTIVRRVAHMSTFVQWPSDIREHHWRTIYADRSRYFAAEDRTHGSTRVPPCCVIHTIIFSPLLSFRGRLAWESGVADPHIGMQRHLTVRRVLCDSPYYPKLT